MGVDVEVIDAGFGAESTPTGSRARLAADRGHAIRAVLAVQTDTASSVRNDIAPLRQAIDAAGHPALLVVDCIASLACDRFEMDAWGADVMVAACQKGLMTPPGVAFVFAGDRALAARVRCPSPYWDWGPRLKPGGLLPALRRHPADPPSLRAAPARSTMILDEEGLEAVWRRHAVLARRGLGGGRGLGHAAASFRLNIGEPGDPQPRGDDDPHRAGRGHAAAALVRRRRRGHARRRACRRRGSTRRDCSASGTWGTSTRRRCSGRSRPSRPGSARSASRTGRARSRPRRRSSRAAELTQPR